MIKAIIYHFWTILYKCHSWCRAAIL